MKTFYFLAVFAFCNIQISTSQCVYNLTHCSCAVGANTGKCLRSSGDNSCVVDFCAPESLVCDCSGSSICELYTCSAMTAVSGVANSYFEIGETITCESSISYCLNSPSITLPPSQLSVSPGASVQFDLSQTPFSIDPTPSSTMAVTPSAEFNPSSSSTMFPSLSPSSYSGSSETISATSTPSLSATQAASTTSSPSESVEASKSSAPLSSVSESPFATLTHSPTTTPFFVFRNVQFGSEVPMNNSFNLEPFTDQNNNLRTSSLSGQWSDGLTQRRMITFRIYSYDSENLLQHMVCAIYNPNTGVPDSYPDEINVKVTLTSSDGNDLTWTYCDDEGECQGSTGVVLRAAHSSSSAESDGFCVGELGASNEYISITFTEVNGIEGIAFEEPNGIIRQYLWADMGLPEAGGLVGAWTTTDGNLVNFGISPEIKFSLQGIPIPLS